MANQSGFGDRRGGMVPVPGRGWMQIEPAGPATIAAAGRLEFEALELASRRCVGEYTVEHHGAWKELETRRLVKNVRSGSGDWYELTEAGEKFLAGLRREKAADDVPGRHTMVHETRND